ncbi:MAG: DUF4390 domain-containing protein [Nitrospirota bacterium]
MTGRRRMSLYRWVSSSPSISFRVILSMVSLLFAVSLCYGADITGPEVSVKDGQIFVNAALTLDDKNIQEIRNGMKKEFRFYIDLFRVWEMWPDEFVSGKPLIRKLKSDPVKTENVASSSDGSTIVQKRFKSFESMMEWALRMDDIRLMSTRDLEPGVYYVRLTAESKVRKLPPVIGYFVIFLPENEFKIHRNSPMFAVGSNK